MSDQLQTILIIALAAAVIVWVAKEGFAISNAEVVFCSSCDIRVATHFLDKDDRYDPHCETCFERDFEECPSCGEWVQKDEIGSIQTMAATRWDPAEYDTVCSQCWPEEDEEQEPDYDSINDERNGY